MIYFTYFLYVTFLTPEGPLNLYAYRLHIEATRAAIARYFRLAAAPSLSMSRLLMRIFERRAIAAARYAI